MKVRIYQPHTHARVRHVPGPKGIVLDVSPDTADFLKQHGVLDPPPSARRVPPLAPPPAAPAAAPAAPDPT